MKTIRTALRVYHVTRPASLDDASLAIVQGLERELARQDQDIADPLRPGDDDFARMVLGQVLRDLARYGCVVTFNN